MEATKDGAAVRAPMKVNGETWLVTAVSMGNPHCITFGKEGECDMNEWGGIKVDALDLPSIGPAFEAHECFPAKTNTVGGGGEWRCTRHVCTRINPVGFVFSHPTTHRMKQDSRVPLALAVNRAPTAW